MMVIELYGVTLSQEEYVSLLMKQTDKERRNRMKMFAHGAMYGAAKEAKVYLPKWLIENIKGWSDG